MQSAPFRPTEPTVMVGWPEIFLVQPARLRSEPANSGFQNRRVVDVNAGVGEGRKKFLEFLRRQRELRGVVLYFPL